MTAFIKTQTPGLLMDEAECKSRGLMSCLLRLQLRLGWKEKKCMDSPCLIEHNSRAVTVMSQYVLLYWANINRFLILSLSFSWLATYFKVEPVCFCKVVPIFTIQAATINDIVTIFLPKLVFCSNCAQPLSVLLAFSVS